MNCHRQMCVVFVLGVAAAGLVSVGCQERAPTGAGVAANKAGPEKTFAEIVHFVRSQVETGVGGMPSGFVTEDSGGRRSQFVIRNDVTSQLIPPAKDDENYRGTITITSNSTYSYRRPEENGRSEDPKDDSDQNGQRRGMFDEVDTEELGIDVMDSDLVSSPSSTKKGDSPSEEVSTVVSRLRDEDVRTFEFEYVNNRWVLKTDPDPDTERAIKNAFDRALAAQP